MAHLPMVCSLAGETGQSRDATGRRGHKAMCMTKELCVTAHNAMSTYGRSQESMEGLDEIGGGGEGVRKTRHDEWAS